MKKHLIAIALGAGLSQMAMATAYKVDFQGTLSTGIKTVDCPPESADCAGFVRDLTFQGQAFSLSLTFEIGSSPGRPDFTTRTTTVVDRATGRNVDSQTAVQRYADWKLTDGTGVQVPSLPDATPNPFDGAPGIAPEVYTTASRNRLVQSFSDDHQALRASEGWTLTNTQLWLDGNGNGFQNYVSLSSSAAFAGGTHDNFDDREPLAYFLDQLARGQNCRDCVSLQWFDSMQSTDGLYSGVQIFGRGGITSITEIAASVPEPATYALMLAGVAAIGFVARRRRAAAALTP